MSIHKFRAWFSDVGFTCRVLVIADMLEEWAETWQAGTASPLREAIEEVRETALLEMERFEAIAKTEGYLLTKQNWEDKTAINSHWLDDIPNPSDEALGPQE